MKNIGWALLATILVFLVSLVVIAPIISNIGYSSVEGSYHLATHAILFSITFTIILCTMILLEEINNIKRKFNDATIE